MLIASIVPEGYVIDTDTFVVSKKSELMAARRRFYEDSGNGRSRLHRRHGDEDVAGEGALCDGVR
jgi:hypothetical protein